MKYKKLLVIIAGVLAGAAAGYLYWHYVGYDEESPFLSTVIASILYGSVLGGLLIAILSSSRQLDT